MYVLCRIFLSGIIISAAVVITRCSSMPSCCVISSPKITLTGDKTAIERQIVGDYRELEKDSWVISSVKTTVQRSGGGAGTAVAGDREIFAAMKIREFHRDKVRKYKDRGLLGEANSGYVLYIKSDQVEKDKKEKDLVLMIVENENSARKQIFTRTLFKSKNKQPSDDEILSFGKVFAQEQRALSQKNDMMQDETGRWVKK